MKRAAWMFLAVTAIGCGGVDESEDEWAEDAEEARINYDYSCRLLPANGGAAYKVHVALRSSTATLSHPCGQAADVRYDTTYRPTSRNAGKVRYKVPSSGVATGCWRSFNQVLLDRTMRSGGGTMLGGAKGGFLRVETTGGGYEKLDFLCTRTTEAAPPAASTVTIEDVKFTAAELTQTLKAANQADATMLAAGGVTSRARTNLLAGRPFSSVEDVAGVSYVGKAALTALKAIGNAHFATATPGTGTGNTSNEATARALAQQMVTSTGTVLRLDGEDPDAFGNGTIMARIDRLGGFASGARIVRPGEPEYFLMVVGKVEDREYVDVFWDGVWFDHGYIEEGETTIQWTGGTQAGMVDSDPTMCACEGRDMKTCHEISGRTFDSTSQMCD